MIATKDPFKRKCGNERAYSIKPNSVHVESYVVSIILDLYICVSVEGLDLSKAKAAVDLIVTKLQVYRPSFSVHEVL